MQLKQKGIVLSTLNSSWMNFIKLFKSTSDIKSELFRLRLSGHKVGFVPTMGTLHQGHLNLVRHAVKDNLVVVVSIFVNPHQFNNVQDLMAYPRMLERDIALLNTLKTEIYLFVPEKEEIYPEDDRFTPIDLKGLEGVLEDKFRPGHFQGVVHVVRNLFGIINPDKAYFGRKDLQQIAVIRRMIECLGLKVIIVTCETIREDSGLAMSSRNLRLSEQQQFDTLIIYQTLQKVVEWSKRWNPAEVKSKAVTFFSAGKLRLEYLEIVNDFTFSILHERWVNPSSCCIAAYCGDVRLIDNMSCH